MGRSRGVLSMLARLSLTMGKSPLSPQGQHCHRGAEWKVELAAGPERWDNLGSMGISCVREGRQCAVFLTALTWRCCLLIWWYWGRKEEVESKTSDLWFGLLKRRTEGHGGLEFGRNPRRPSSEEQSWVCPGHFLQDSDEEADVQWKERLCAWLGENLEPWGKQPGEKTVTAVAAIMITTKMINKGARTSQASLHNDGGSQTVGR
ncbi:hypothetical protein EDB86DRAFT_2834692 [Lactarius hatsudake]|nr:hypothetical protein EDB86DRAFT_2834692 [Lactarius hatsudake]